MAMIQLALKSLYNRKASMALTLLTIALSVFLILGVEKLRHEVKYGFTRSLSGADLIVGPRSSPVQLMLYSIFRIGDPSQGLSWESYQEVSAMTEVAWSIPLSLGDAHRGYRVVGTTNSYFEHYQFADRQALDFAQGEGFDHRPLVTVIGAEVAAALGYGLGQTLVLAHGTGAVSFSEHGSHPFEIRGVLSPTGTPVDRAIYVPLAGLELIHGDQAHGSEVEPEQITAFILGLKNRVQTFVLQRRINEFKGEPLSAILPGLTLQQLWRLFGLAEKALLWVSSAVVLTGLLGMTAILVGSLRERRREMAILRAVGARPWQVFLLLQLEALGLALAGVLMGFIALYGLLFITVAWAQDFIVSRFGVYLSFRGPNASELWIALSIMLASVIVASIPSFLAYRRSLSDGLTLRV